MNIRYLLYASALTVLVFLGGCLYGQCINGPCPLERQRIIKNIKPYGTRWIKDGSSDEQRLVDIAECGGVGTHVGFTHEKIRAEKKTNDPDDFPAIFRLRATWEQCMALKGYHFE